MSTVRIAIVQQETAPDLVRGLERTADFARQVAREGATLVAFPETWLPGYPAWIDCCRDAALWDHAPVKAAYVAHQANAVEVDGASGCALGAIARDAGVTLVIGVVERVASGPGNGTLYNALLTYGADGTLLNHHRKLVPTYTERMLWGPGDANGLRTVDAGFGRVGGLVCWEHWMPLARQALHEAGEHLHVAVWPTVNARHQLASRHYAFEGRCYVLAVGGLMRASALPAGLDPDPERVPNADALVMRGGSAVIGPDGEYVVEPVFDTPAILTAELDLSRCTAERMTLDVAGHYARPDCLRLTVDRRRFQGVDA